MSKQPDGLTRPFKEGSVRRGGVNRQKQTPRPAPPKGITRTTEIECLKCGHRWEA